MKFEEPKNRNYCAVVVELSTFVDLPNCDRLKAALIFGNSVIVDKDTPAGAVGLFFPVETQLTRDFLANNNLFRKPEWGNVDPEAKGFFEEHGRVKCMKFRGNKSEGFWLPIQSLSYLGIPLSEFPVGAELDSVEDRVICRKYVPARNSHVGTGPKQARQPRMEDRIVEGQFRFHPDTENLRRNVHKIKPEMWISISDKWHGTSVVIANVLLKRELGLLERIAKRLGVRVQEEQYGLTWSSRRVVKGIDGETKQNAVHFYSSDIWGVVAKEVADRIPKGVTLYGEIVGYTPDGTPIQKGYAYGCQPKQHRLLIYRVTYTSAAGLVFEFPWLQMKEFCRRLGFETVKELWYGQACDLFATNGPIDDLSGWQADLLHQLEYNFANDQMCPHNNNEVPAEGIVLKVDDLTDDIAFKLKNFKFLKHESDALDKGEGDFEAAEEVDPVTAFEAGEADTL